MIFIGKLSQIDRFLREQAKAGQSWRETPGTGMHLGRGVWAVRLEKGGEAWNSENQAH